MLTCDSLLFLYNFECSKAELVCFKIHQRDYSSLSLPSKAFCGLFSLLYSLLWSFLLSDFRFKSKLIDDRKISFRTEAFAEKYLVMLLFKKKLKESGALPWFWRDWGA